MSCASPIVHPSAISNLTFIAPQPFQGRISRDDAADCIQTWSSSMLLRHTLNTFRPPFPPQLAITQQKHYRTSTTRSGWISGLILTDQTVRHNNMTVGSTTIQRNEINGTKSFDQGSSLDLQKMLTSKASKVDQMNLRKSEYPWFSSKIVDDQITVPKIDHTHPWSSSIQSRDDLTHFETWNCIRSLSFTKLKRFFQTCLVISALFITPWLAISYFGITTALASDLPDNIKLSEPVVLLRGTVYLPPDITLTPCPSSSCSSLSSSSSSDPHTTTTMTTTSCSSPPALYITVRVDRPNNVPQAILDGTRGKPPPVLAVRRAEPRFPYEFELTESDLTIEGGRAGGEGAATADVDHPQDDEYWWKGANLIVSARWDTDGVASTRDPTDLVGRALWKHGSKAQVSVNLQGRGFGGKLITSKSC